MKIKYYSLKENKEMQDGSTIQGGQKLALLKKEKDMFFFETDDSTDIKKIFWAKNDEVIFLNEVEKKLTEKEKQEKEIIISGNFLSLL